MVGWLVFMSYLLSLICGCPCWDIVSCLNIVVHVLFICLVVVLFYIVLNHSFVCRCCELYYVESLMFKVGWLVIVDCYCVFVFVVQVLFSECVVYFTGNVCCQLVICHCACTI